METFSVNRRAIALRREGAGATVIAVHCSSSHSGQWKPLIEAVSDRCEIIAPDMHGYGRSEAFPKDGAPWYVHDAAMLQTLIDEADGPMHLVGHSLGGAVCTFVAINNPNVASLCVYEPVLFTLLEQAGDDAAKDAWFISSVVHGLLRLGRRNDP